jgi:DNA-directed RNA polymerase subunit RPC12/RpoP
MSDVCGFCRGLPVLSAASWTSLSAPRYAACPRCGVKRVPEAERELELARERTVQR